MTSKRLSDEDKRATEEFVEANFGKLANRSWLFNDIEARAVDAAVAHFRNVCELENPAWFMALEALRDRMMKVLASCPNCGDPDFVQEQGCLVCRWALSD